MPESAPGATVSVMFGAANDDETVFEAAHLDLSRGPARSGRHLAFGYGAHFCLGAQLARAEARIALETLLPRMSDLSLDPAGLSSRNQNPLLRGFSRLVWYSSRSDPGAPRTYDGSWRSPPASALSLSPDSSASPSPRPSELRHRR